MLAHRCSLQGAFLTVAARPIKIACADLKRSPRIPNPIQRYAPSLLHSLPQAASLEPEFAPEFRKIEARPVARALLKALHFLQQNVDSAAASHGLGGLPGSLSIQGRKWVVRPASVVAPLEIKGVSDDGSQRGCIVGVRNPDCIGRL